MIYIMRIFVSGINVFNCKEDYYIVYIIYLTYNMKIIAISGEATIRFVLSALHSKEDIERTVQSFTQVATEVGIQPITEPDDFRKLFEDVKWLS